MFLGPLKRFSSAVRKVGISGFAGFSTVGSVAQANKKAFDEIPLEWSLTLDGPMNTIAGVTDFAREINHVYGITTIVTSLIFFAVAIPVIYCLWRFRVKEKDLAGLPPPPQVHGNAILEMIWTVVPVILLIIIWIPTQKAIFNQFDGVAKAKTDPEAVKIQAIGHQWWWEFRYSGLNGVEGEIVTANEVHLPENTPVIFEVFSEDVIHSFWIPNFGGKIDALPGLEKKNYLYYTTPPVSERGRSEGGDYYQGQCVELCGASHALMRFAAIVHSRDEFMAWASSHNTPPLVETTVEKKGEEVFQRCMACHTLEGTLSASLPGPKIGPNLSNFGNRRTLGAGTRANTVENLRQWINHPETIKPGSLMPGQALTPDELEAVIAYIRTSTIKQF